MLPEMVASVSPGGNGVSTGVLTIVTTLSADLGSDSSEALLLRAGVRANTAAQSAEGGVREERNRSMTHTLGSSTVMRRQAVRSPPLTVPCPLSFV